jgi:hypothetical protein
MEDYEHIPDPGDGWQPTNRDIRRQRQSEDIRSHAREMAASAPPLSQQTLERLATLLSRPTPRHDLIEWRLRIFCGHVVTRTAHHTHTTVHAAFTGSVKCGECGLDPATIIAAEAIGRLEPHRSEASSRPRSLDRQRIEAEIARHERAVARLRTKLD